MRIPVLIAALSLPAAAYAQEVEIGTGIICDTAVQLEEVVKTATETRSLGVSMERVNAAAGGTTPACAVASVAFVRGETVKQISTPDGLRDIVQIYVVGAVLGPGSVRPVQPLPQFTLFKAKGEQI